MEYYYLLDQGLEGLVSPSELANKLAIGEVHPHTPVWNPVDENWISCAAANLASEGTALMQFDDDMLDTSQAYGPQIKRNDLPRPQELLALRICTERQLITAHQYRRILDEMLNNNENASYESSILGKLEDQKWITSEQRESIEQDLLEDTVPRRIAGYEIIDELGRGGMGITYRARQISMDRLVALKVLLPRWSQDNDYIERFHREAQMAARLNHENIATAYEVDEDNGQHFFSMEYIEGRTLDHILDECETLPEERVSNIGMQICRALEHAYDHGVIHRDISAKNIIVKEDGTVKVIDMGLAKSIEGGSDSHLTSEGLIMGTPAYMSPERASGEDHVDVRSDIYSLGCVFYEMLTGEAPLLGNTKYETISLHIHQPVPNIKEARPEISDRMAHLIQRMTALDPVDRFQNPSEIMSGFSADADSVRQALLVNQDIPPVSDQLSRWDGEAVEIRLRHDGREYVHLVAQKLDGKLEDAGVDPEFQGLAQTIFTELIANAFDHGCSKIQNGVVVIRMELNSAFFRVEVTDPGPGFAAQDMVKRLKNEPIDRERQRGLFQVAAISDLLEYSNRGNQVKSVLYRKSEGSGIQSHQSEDITYVEIKGKGDLALTENFKRWVENLDLSHPHRLCLMVRTDWVSSMFVATIGKLETRMRENSCALSVWVEHRSCFRIMQQLGVTSFVHVYDSLESAEMALRYKSIGNDNRPQTEENENGEDDTPDNYSEKEEDDTQDNAAKNNGNGTKSKSRKGKTGKKRSTSRKGHQSKTSVVLANSYRCQRKTDLWSRIRRILGG